MTKIPFSGRLDLSLASLLVAERHHSLANRTVTTTDVAADVIDLVDLLEVEADDLLTIEEFEDAVHVAMERLVEAGWLKKRSYRGVIRYTAAPLGEDALDWIRDRLSDQPKVRHMFDELEAEVTDLVLERYEGALREAPAAADE
jgi:hypothetical protein